jgi:uncharacterized membrane protein
MKTDLWIELFPIVLLAILLHWMPLWRRSGVWFGVTVPPDFGNEPEARETLRLYRLETWGLSFGALLLAFAGGQWEAAWMPAAAVVLQTVGATAAFALARRRILPYAQRMASVRSASVGLTREGFPGGAASALVPFSVLIAAGVYLRANWQRIPARFPMHWGASGTPDRWGSPTWQNVYGPLLICAPLVGLLLLLGWAILRGSPRARVAATADWTARLRRANLLLLIAITWGISVMFGAISLSPLFAPREMPGAMVWFPMALLLGTIFVFGWRMIRISQEPRSGSDGTPDECWKLGQFYYNPDDPALMVERRFGIGYTVNFGNRLSWLLMGVLLLIVIAPMALG